MKKLSKLLFLVAIVGAGVAGYNVYKKKAERYEITKIGDHAYQCVYSKEGKETWAIAETYEKALEKAKKIYEEKEH